MTIASCVACGSCTVKDVSDIKLSWFGLGFLLRECECEAPFKLLSRRQPTGCASESRLQDCNIANPVSNHQDFKPSPVLTVTAHRNLARCPLFLPSILYLSTGILGPATPQRHSAAGANVAHAPCRSAKLTIPSKTTDRFRQSGPCFLRVWTTLS